jgi:hypothetical protein
LIAFLYCPLCRRAWTAGRVDPCDVCGGDPVSCSPWGGERRVWLDARLDATPGKRAGVVDVVYRDHRDHRRSLLRGIRAKGNMTTRTRTGWAGC